MRHTLRTFVVAVSLLAFSTTLAAVPPTPPARPIASGEVVSGVLTVSPTISFDSATLRVAGPARYEAITWSRGETLVLDLLAEGRIAGSDGTEGGAPAVLPDGRYGYEVVFYLSDGDRRVHGGIFSLANGRVVSPRGGRGATPPKRAELAPDAGTEGSNDLSAKGGSTGDTFLIGDANHNGEANLQIRANNPDGTLINYWGVRNKTGDLHLSTSNGANWVDYFTFKPTGRLGIGTTMPQADLHIFRPGGTLRIADSDACPNPNSAWEMEEDFGRLRFGVVPNCPGDSTGGKMWITGTGRVGIGTNSPLTDLHVQSELPEIHLSDQDPCPDKFPSWRILNNYGFLDVMTRDDCTGSGSIALSIESGGRIGIGTAFPTAKLHVIGDAIVEGDVAFGSSRTIKHEIEPLDGAEMLSSIRELPLYEWTYREDPLQARHVGPMAEDVHAAFRLGRDERHLSPADSAGLALAAIQGLDRQVAALRADNTELAAQNRELLERLAAIEARLARPDSDRERTAH